MTDKDINRLQLLSFISFSMVRLHVVFGLPLFRFPSGVHLRATFVMSSEGLRRT
jgi:hypothetical protein